MWSVEKDRTVETLYVVYRSMIVRYLCTVVYQVYKFKCRIGVYKFIRWGKKSMDRIKIWKFPFLHPILFNWSDYIICCFSISRFFSFAFISSPLSGEAKGNWRWGPPPAGSREDWIPWKWDATSSGFSFCCLNTNTIPLDSSYPTGWQA